MRVSTLSVIAVGLGLLSLAGGGAALAQGAVVGPEPWQFGFQPAASPIKHQVNDLHDLLLWIITGITLFVLALMAYACWRFRETRNPTPSKRTHHTLLEVTWTAVPVLILVVIAIPSFKLLYYQEVTPPSVDLTVKVIGRQWYWTYEYPDHGNFTFDAYMIPSEEIQDGQHRLLDTDNRVVLPVDANIRLLITGSDVIHSWYVPAFGMKKDAIPGRLNEMWIRIDHPGIYYGQCYELCGAYHPFMPITVEAVTREQFEAWVGEAQQRFARVDGDGGFEVARGPEQPQQLQPSAQPQPR